MSLEDITANELWDRKARTHGLRAVEPDELSSEPGRGGGQGGRAGSSSRTAVNGDSLIALFRILETCFKEVDLKCSHPESGTMGGGG